MLRCCNGLERRSRMDGVPAVKRKKSELLDGDGDGAGIDVNNI